MAHTVAVFRRLCRAATLVGTLRRAGLPSILPVSCIQLEEGVAIAVR